MINQITRELPFESILGENTIYLYTLCGKSNNYRVDVRGYTI